MENRPAIAPPRVVAAAIIGHDGVPYSLPAPARHHDVIGHMVALGHPTPIKGEQGFMLSDGSFADRRRALGNAVVNDQLLPGAGKRRWLFSEDVW